MGERKLTGYCLRCGGDCYDTGHGGRNLHRCPPKRPAAGAIVAAKFACDKALSAAEGRPWAKNLSAMEYEELKLALRCLRDALAALAPQRVA